MPANSTQPAMVLKRSSMSFPDFPASARRWICAAFKGEFGAYFKPRAERAQAPARRRGGRGSADRLRSSRSSGCHQPSPCGSARGNDDKVEREMGEDMADGADARRARRRRSLPIAAGQRGHSAEQALGGPADQPHRAVALGPISDAVSMRAHGARLGAPGIAPGSPLANAWHSAAAGIRRSAAASAGRSSRRDPSSPG